MQAQVSAVRSTKFSSIGFKSPCFYSDSGNIKSHTSTIRKHGRLYMPVFWVEKLSQIFLQTVCAVKPILTLQCCLCEHVLENILWQTAQPTGDWVFAQSTQCQSQCSLYQLKERFAAEVRLKNKGSACKGDVIHFAQIGAFYLRIIEAQNNAF